MAQVRLENIFKSYGKNNVHTDLSLTIDDGECFTLLGPSGCGKSVLLRMIAGFESPDRGSIYIGDRLVANGEIKKSVTPDLRDIGVVFQDYAVWPHMTVFENIAYPLKIKKESSATIKEKVLKMADMVKLTDLEQRIPSQLSGGQQQRVALARALIGGPSLLLLDEPLSNLDANLRGEMRFEIKELQKKLGVTVFYVTHDHELELATADRLAVMDKTGVIAQVGTPSEVYEKPENDFVFRFLGVSGFLPVTKRGDDFFTGEEKLHIKIDNAPQTGKLTLAFRPSDVTLSRHGDGTKGKVLRASFLGANMDYLIGIGGSSVRTRINTLDALADNLLFREGEKCLVSFHNAYLFANGRAQWEESV